MVEAGHEGANVRTRLDFGGVEEKLVSHTGPVPWQCSKTYSKKRWKSSIPGANGWRPGWIGRGGPHRGRS